MPKSLITKAQGKKQLCKHLLYEPLAGKCEYTAQPKIPLGVMLLIQRVQYYHWYLKINLY